MLAKDWWEQPHQALDQIVRLADGADTDEASSEPALEEAPIEDEEPASVNVVEQSPPDGSANTNPADATAAADPDLLTAFRLPTSGTRRALDRYFEYVGGSSRKFWAISVAGTAQTIRFGRIGSAGQKQSKEFSDADLASQEAERQIAKKRAKGYYEPERLADGPTRP